MKYQPIGDGVLIKKLPMPSASKGGILLPATAIGQIVKGEVVAVGPGDNDIQMQIKIGDVVLYYVKRELPVDDFILISQRDIYLICLEESAVASATDLSLN